MSLVYENDLNYEQGSQVILSQPYSSFFVQNTQDKEKVDATPAESDEEEKNADWSPAKNSKAKTDRSAKNVKEKTN